MKKDLKIPKSCRNKYNIKPEQLKSIKVLNWRELKKYTKVCENSGKNPYLYYLVGCNADNEEYDDYEEFWIGFYQNGTIDYVFTIYGGMFTKNFIKFYDYADIKFKADLQVQMNALNFINMLVDKEIISIESINNIKTRFLNKIN